MNLHATVSNLQDYGMGYVPGTAPAYHEKNNVNNFMMNRRSQEEGGGSKQN